MESTMSKRSAVPTPEEKFERHRELFKERTFWASYVRWKVTNHRAMEEANRTRREARGYATLAEQLADIRDVKRRGKGRTLMGRVYQLSKR